jgi:hypothetical protein
MIQMRENRYEDIRNGIVNRSIEVTKTVSSNPSNNSTKAAAPKPNHDFDPRANQADEYLDDEYNSWS